jgi:hypothetical protein
VAIDRGNQSAASATIERPSYVRADNNSLNAPAETRGMTLDDPIFTIGVVHDLPSLDLTSCSANLLEAVAADDSVATGS